MVTFDDLYYDTVYDKSESHDDDGGGDGSLVVEDVDKCEVKVGGESATCKKRKICRSFRSHLASGVWNLCREQGNKLLASRFRGDCLYICDWPGCLHTEEKRNYMLFRGILRTLSDLVFGEPLMMGTGVRLTSIVHFVTVKRLGTYILLLFEKGFGYHDDGEPVVRAYVCENGHVSGAWTDLPLYT